MVSVLVPLFATMPWMGLESVRTLSTVNKYVSVAKRSEVHCMTRKKGNGEYGAKSVKVLLIAGFHIFLPQVQ